MNVVIPVLELLLGFALLIKGADYLVDGASAIARRFGIPSIIIGLTIVAFGTSAPELLVSLIANLSGKEGIALGNILGSNVANIVLIMGITAIICPMVVPKRTAFVEIPFTLLITIICALLLNDFFSNSTSPLSLSRLDGIILITIFSGFLFYLYKQAKAGRAKAEDREEAPLLKNSLFSLGGIIGLAAGGHFCVEGAVTIAQDILHVSELLVGLTIVAFGTSLPELVTCVVAARKGHTDIAVGNLIGSNIFNLLWVLGLSAIITPIAFTPGAFMSGNNFDLAVNVAILIGLFACLFIGKRLTIKAWQGWCFLVVYVLYIAHIVYHQAIIA